MTGVPGRARAQLTAQGLEASLDGRGESRPAIAAKGGDEKPSVNIEGIFFSGFSTFHLKSSI